MPHEEELCKFYKCLFALSGKVQTLRVLVQRLPDQMDVPKANQALTQAADLLEQAMPGGAGLEV